jgi:hypothetical protein
MRLWLLALALAACSGPSPTPDPPGPQPIDAPVVDTFDGATVDCALDIVGAEAAATTPRVRTCLDASNTGECLAALYPAAARDTIACIVRDLDMLLHVEVAKGTANEQMRAEAARASAWIWAKRIGFRN